MIKRRREEIINNRKTKNGKHEYEKHEKLDNDDKLKGEKRRTGTLIINEPVKDKNAYVEETSEGR